MLFVITIMEQPTPTARITNRITVVLACSDPAEETSQIEYTTYAKSNVYEVNLSLPTDKAATIRQTVNIHRFFKRPPKMGNEQRNGLQANKHTVILNTRITRG